MKQIKARFSESISSSYVEIRKATIKINDSLQTATILCATAPYAHKDELKDWATAGGGGWHTIDRVWYRPIGDDNFAANIESLKELSCLNHGGSIDFLNLPESAKKAVQKCFAQPSVLPREGIVHTEYSVFPEEESRYVADPAYVRDGEELPQIQAFACVGGKEIRVLVSRDEQDCTPAAIFNNNWRKFIDETGGDIWARPWQNPTVRDDWQSWPEPIDEIDSPPPPVELPIGLKVSLIVDPEKNPIALRAQIEKGTTRFWQLKNWCAQWPGSRWEPERRSWRIPYSEEVLEGLASFKAKIDADPDWWGCRSEFSAGVKASQRKIVPRSELP